MVLTKQWGFVDTHSKDDKFEVLFFRTYCFRVNKNENYMDYLQKDSQQKKTPFVLLKKANKRDLIKAMDWYNGADYETETVETQSVESFNPCHEKVILIQYIS